MPSRRPSPATVLALVAGFLLLRAALFAVTTAGEYALYQSYAQGARDTSLAELYRVRNVEYPPLGILFGVVALHVTDVLPDGVEKLTVFRPNPSRSVESSRYEVGLSLTLFLVDLACLLLVYLVARKAYPDESPSRMAARLGVYVAASTAIGLIMYDRQDLVVGLFPMLALIAFARNWSLVAYAVLSAGVAYKLVPVLLFPLWVLAFTAIRSAPATTRSFLLAMVKEAAIAGLILAAYPVLSYLLWGPRSFLFLTFHSDRGLQLESSAAWLVFVFDPDALVGYSHGSHSVLSPLANRVAKLATLATVAGEVFVVVLVGRGFWQAATGPNPPDRNRMVTHLATGSLLAWLAFILFNKVGSPQYLLWLVPLLPLLPLRSRCDWGFAVVLLLGMFFTSLVFPGQYPLVRGELIRGDEDAELTQQVWSGPIPLGTAMIAAKSISLTTAFVWLTVIVWRSPPPQAAAETHSPRGS